MDYEEEKLPAWNFKSVIAVFSVCVCVVIFSFADHPHKQKSHQLTSIVSTEKNWELASDWQEVNGTKTLYTAEARRPGDKVKHQIFLESLGCSDEIIVRYPGKKFDVVIIMASQTNGTTIMSDTGITGNQIAFVKQDCY